MKIEINLANDKTANIVRNIYPLYLHDLSEFSGETPNKYGIYEAEEIRTLDEQYHIQDIWFNNPEELFPFIICVDGKPAGFALISTGKYAPKSTDYYVYEFFILKPYRGRNIAELAAKEVFDRFKGKWELDTHPSTLNQRAQSFWTKTIKNYTSGNFEKAFGTNFNGERLIFRFNNN